MSIFNWFFKTKQATNKTQEVYPDIFTATKEDYKYHLNLANENAKHRVNHKNRLEEIEEQLHNEDWNGYYMTPRKENAEYDIVKSFMSFAEVKSFMDVLGEDFNFSYEIKIGNGELIKIYAIKK